RAAAEIAGPIMRYDIVPVMTRNCEAFAAKALALCREARSDGSTCNPRMPLDQCHSACDPTARSYSQRTRSGAPISANAATGRNVLPEYARSQIKTRTG